MYFLNDIHKANFEHLTSFVFKYAKNDYEYCSMCYIQALPDIYDRCIKDGMFREFPFLWTVKYKDTSYTDFDDDREQYHVIDFEVETDENGKEVESEAFGTLSSGYVKMVYLAKNLFNSNNDEFNLMQSLNTWDDDLLKVFEQALNIRSGNVKFQ